MDAPRAGRLGDSVDLSRSDRKCFGLILHPAGAWLWTVFDTGSRREDREVNVYKELQEPPTFETGTPFFRRYSAGALVSRALLQMKGVQRPTETSHCSCPGLPLLGRWFLHVRVMMTPGPANME